MRVASVFRKGIVPAVLTALMMAATPANAAGSPATDEGAKLAGRLAEVKISKQINYFPAEAGWSKMWTDFDVKAIDADFAAAAAVGADSVRAIIFPSTFGYPTPKPEYTTKLAQFVTLAAAHGLSVKFTLFDWWDGYSDTAGSAAWATALLTPYRYDDRIISVGVQNELDPDNAAAIAWAKKIVPAIRAAAPGLPLTISISATDGIPGLTKLKAAMAGTPLDYYDFHFYANSERALSILQQAKAAVAPAPLVIGETGLSSLSYSDGEQAAFLARVFQAAGQAGIASIAPWTLNDVSPGAIPESAVSKIPGQYQFGLYRIDGSAKPAAAVVKAAWAGAAYPAGLMDPGFENAVGQTRGGPTCPSSASPPRPRRWPAPASGRSR
ncbi:cellulase family glycosylhydrolase [Paractinoplanes durhamensis]|uniref:cellulase family glycosylhydrolase n=1 Tax=Paractinoplanes durhamensis TaxID=113563 RepID=UPI003627DEF8